MKFAAIGDFWAGAVCTVRGCRLFYTDFRAWKYVLLPWTLLIGAYLLLFRVAFVFTDRFADWAGREFAELPKYLAWLSVPCQWSIWLLATVGALILLVLTVSAFYAMLGGIFFDALAAYRLRTGYDRETEPFAWRRTFRLMLDSCRFGLETLIVGGAVFVLSFFLPVVGPILLAAVFGYYLAISLLLAAANCRGMRLAELRARARANRAAVLGFGVAAYCLLLIPFAMLFLLPGFVLGGAELFALKLDEPR